MINDRILKLVPIAFVLLWSTGFIGAKYSMPYAEPFTLLGIRMAVATAFLMLMTVLIKTRWPSYKGALHSVVVGLLVHAVYLGGVFAAIKQGLPAGLTALIVGLQPILTAILAWLWWSEQLTFRQITGLILGLFGVTLVLMFRQTGQFNLELTANGLVFTLLAVFGISVGTLYQKKYCGDVNLIAGTFYQYLGTTAAMAMLAFAFETRVVEWTLTLILALAWLIIVLSIAAVLLLMLMIREGKATTVAVYFYLTPPLTTLLSWILFDERPGIVALIGIGVASAGVYLARR